jgi:hypothetical protein
MVIEIKAELFEDKSEIINLKFLIQLCFYLNRYTLYSDYSLILNSENFLSLDSIDQELLIQSFNEIIQGGLQPQIIISKNSDDVFFCTNEAIKYLSQPVSIILENSLNDSYFMSAIIKHFDDSLVIKRHINNNWIQFDNAGGATNIINLIDGKLNSYLNWPKKIKNKYLKCFVVFDSDKLSPQKELKIDKTNCKEYLIKNKVIHHILQKREMENYLPDDVINNIADDYLKLYLKLTSIQKDYFDIQKGFQKNRSDKNNDSDILDLYKDLTDQDWISLKNGLKLAPYDKSFKSEFPKLFKDKLINRKNLESRLNTTSSPNELEEIIIKTLSLI